MLLDVDINLYFIFFVDEEFIDEEGGLKINGELK